MRVTNESNVVNTYTTVVLIKQEYRRELKKKRARESGVREM